MGLELDDLERTLSYSIFCDRCGYNLRHAPYVGRCPECGNGYNARPLVLKGIFSAPDLKLPLLDMFVVLACVGVGAVMIAGALRSSERGMLGYGVVFVVLGLLLFSTVWRALARYVRFSRIVRRAESEEEND